MKAYINLFKQQVKQKKSILILGKARKVGMILIGILVIVIAIEWSAFFYLTQSLSEKEKVKNRYYGFILQNQQIVTKINKLLFKYDLLKQYVAQDGNIYFYYDLLTTLIDNVGSAGTLTAFSIDREQSVTFNIEFSSYEQVLGFLSQMESGSFIEYFDQLEIKEFNMSYSENPKYLLEFSGKFKTVIHAS